MRKLMTAGLAGVTLAAGALASTPAAAQVGVDSPGFERVQYYGGNANNSGYGRGYGNRGYNHGYDNRGYNRGYYNRGRRGGGDEAAAAIIGGVLGFALGTAVAPRQQYYAPSYGYGYSQPTYYQPRYYAPPPPRYYAPPPRYYAPQPYYGRPHYYGGYGY